MNGTVFTILILAMVAVLAVLFLGLFSMARGGEFNRKYGNKLMRLRVAAQALVILLLAILFLTMGR